MVGQIGRCSPSGTEGPLLEGVLCSYKGRLHHLGKVTAAFLPRALMRSYNERSCHLCKVMRGALPSVFQKAWYILLIALLICDI